MGNFFGVSGVFSFRRAALHHVGDEYASGEIRAASGSLRFVYGSLALIAWAAQEDSWLYCAFCPAAGRNGRRGQAGGAPTSGLLRE